MPNRRSGSLGMRLQAPVRTPVATHRNRMLLSALPPHRIGAVPPQAVTVPFLLELQRLAGNRATASLIPTVQRRYSRAEIARRRLVKTQTLDALCNIAILGKVGIRTLWRNEPLEVAAAVTAFFVGLDGPAITTLRTAKGCNTRPRGVENQDTTLYEFLQGHTTGQACSQGFAHDCVLWAEHLARQNPRNGQLQAAWATRRGEVNAARAQAEREYREFYKRPAQRQPATPDEAKFWLVYYRHERDMDEELWEISRAQFEIDFRSAGFDRLTWARTATLRPEDFVPDYAR